MKFHFKKITVGLFLAFTSSQFAFSQSIVSGTNLIAGTDNLSAGQLNNVVIGNANGNSNVSGNQNVAIGYGAITTGVSSTNTDSVSIGANASSAASSVSIGSGALTYNSNAIAIGAGATVRNLSGNSGGVALGLNSSSTGVNSVAIGANSSDGGLSNVFSVGSTYTKRQIINVSSAGVISATNTNAVNGSDLFVVQTTANSANSTAASALTSSTANTASISTLKTNVSSVQAQVNQNSSNIIAANAAITSVQSNVAAVSAVANNANTTAGNALTVATSANAIANNSVQYDAGTKGTSASAVTFNNPTVLSNVSQVTSTSNMVSVGTNAVQIISGSSTNGGNDVITTDGNAPSGANLHLGGAAISSNGTSTGQTVNVVADGVLVANKGIAVASGQTIDAGSNQIKNVSAGTANTDAANVGQVTEAKTAAITTANQYTDSQISTVNSNIGQSMASALNQSKSYTDQLVGKEVNRAMAVEAGLQRNINAVGAMAAAGTVLTPGPYSESKRTYVSMGVGTYQGATAMSAGVSHYISPSARINAAMSTSAGYGASFAVGASVGF